MWSRYTRFELDLPSFKPPLYAPENRILLRQRDAVGQRDGDAGQDAEQGHQQGDRAQGEAEAARDSRNPHPEADSCAFTVQCGEARRRPTSILFESQHRCYCTCFRLRENPENPNAKYPQFHSKGTAIACRRVVSAF